MNPTPTRPSSKIPLQDLRAQNAALAEEILPLLREHVLDSAFIGGRAVTDFEREFAAFCGTRHAVGVASGTDALVLALRALGVGPGDAVITVPMTFVATVAAIVLAGAQPVLVDVDPDTRTMDPDALAAVLESPPRRDDKTLRIAAILPVHLHGLPADMRAICEIADRFGVPVVEDAAQAHGASIGNRRCGAFGVLGCFSFYPGKNLGAFGDAGAVTTDDEELRSRVAILANHGRTSHVEHAAVGTNSRLDAIQAAVLRVKLRHLEAWNERRRRIAAFYDRTFERGGIRPAPTGTDRRHVYHQYVIETPRRATVRQRLQEAGVQTGVHYPVPVHLQPGYAFLGHGPGSFPTSERLADTMLSLPMFPELSDADVERAAEAVVAAVHDAERGGP